ncbi:MAG TPA: hypothetical protein VK489_08435 [Ferruginibacter sp.]|nr:hypothetical protein [Ferruginibacter sp.]
MKKNIVFVLLLMVNLLHAQVSKVWVADNGNGTYKNPVVNADYSDPDGDGNNYSPIGEKLTAKPGRWVGAKVGLFCTRTVKTNDSGSADIDWFRIDK